MTTEEEKFLVYWQEQRLRKKQFLRKISIGAPFGVLIAVGLLVNLLSGWYRRATAELNSSGSLIIVILLALISIVVFMTIMTAHHRWDRNEASYLELLQRKEKEEAMQHQSEG